jgi:hypothetical protein
MNEKEQVSHPRPASRRRDREKEKFFSIFIWTREKRLAQLHLRRGIHAVMIQYFPR